MNGRAMTCREAVGRPMAYVEERLARAERDGVEAQLNVCPRCTEFAQAYRRTPEICRRATEKRISEGVARRVWQCIQNGLGS